VPSVYPTIQAAVTAASPGDEIIVAAGSYGEIVTIDKALTLRSSAGAASTVLNGGITVSANNVTIEGFTVNDGASMGENAGIYIVASTSGHTIIGNILNGPGSACNPPDQPCYRGIVTGYNVSNMTVSDNTICDWTSGIYLNPGSNFTISGNTFCSNEAGIGSDGIDGVRIVKNIFTSNDEGWGVSNAGADVHANFNEFYGNTVNGVRNYCDMDPPLPADPCDPAESWVDATYNWWGDVCGPEGGGDTMEGNVLFDPWYSGVECLRYYSGWCDHQQCIGS
jgi:parallel beta-helix repeat protein